MKFAAVALLLTISTGAIAEEDTLCQQLTEFRNAPFEKDAQGKPLRRYIEYHWLGYWLDLDNGWSWKCAPRDTPAAKKFCEYLMDHVSFEFPETLPVRILTCNGWKIPDTFNLSLEKISVDISRDEKGNSIDRRLMLETDMRPHKPQQDYAIRLSIIPDNEAFVFPEPQLIITYPDNVGASQTPK